MLAGKEFLLWNSPTRNLIVVILKLFWIEKYIDSFIAPSQGHWIQSLIIIISLICSSVHEIIVWTLKWIIDSMIIKRSLWLVTKWFLLYLHLFIILKHRSSTHIFSSICSKSRLIEIIFLIIKKTVTIILSTKVSVGIEINISIHLTLSLHHRILIIISIIR